MPLLTIPNVSEGRDAQVISKLSDALEAGGCRVLDVHTDAVHNRSVFTAVGRLDRGLAELASRAASLIDLRVHTGAHPRVGVVDVCPVVPHGTAMDEAVDTAHAVGEEIATRAGLPVYFYDHAAADARSLPEIRAGGLTALMDRARTGLAPDLGPREIDPRTGVVCVGARDALIAFNVWIRSGPGAARAIARTIRERDGGLAGVRALGLEMSEGLAQVSMNLTRPEETGILAAFGAVVSEAVRMGIEVEATELVGLVPERYLPAPDAEAARLLIEPGRSLEAALTS
jgi:glutamate formiminotransferase